MYPRTVSEWAADTDVSEGGELGPEAALLLWGCKSNRPSYKSAACLFLWHLKRLLTCQRRESQPTDEVTRGSGAPMIGLGKDAWGSREVKFLRKNDDGTQEIRKV